MRKTRYSRITTGRLARRDEGRGMRDEKRIGFALSSLIPHPFSKSRVLVNSLSCVRHELFEGAVRHLEDTARGVQHVTLTALSGFFMGLDHHLRSPAYEHIRLLIAGRNKGLVDVLNPHRIK